MTELINTITPIKTVAKLKEKNLHPVLVQAVEGVKDAPEAIKNEVAFQFIDFFAKIEAYTAKAFELIVTDETETGKMGEAMMGMKALKELKKAFIAKFDEGKEDVRRIGQTYDAVNRHGKALIDPAIEHLKAQAEFAERKEAARIEALRVERYNLILDYLVPEILPTPYPEWGTMTESEFADTLAFAQEKARQIEAQRLARIEKEKADREELERLRIETANQARELEAAKAKEEAARRELEQQQRAQAQKAEQERKLALQAENIARAVATAPDRDKLRRYGNQLQGIEKPELESEDMRKVLADVGTLLKKINNFIAEKTAK